MQFLTCDVNTYCIGIAAAIGFDDDGDVVAVFRGLDLAGGVGRRKEVHG
jgi:hypothetical protein